MSKPTRGMVAGQPITTQAQTKEFDEGYDRIFGTDRKPARGRYVWTAEGLVQVGGDWTDAERRAQTATEELTYGNGIATDGTPINTRRRHREYLKATGTTMASDYTETWAKAAEQRERAAKGDFDHKARREAIERAVYQRSKP